MESRSAGGQPGSLCRSVRSRQCAISSLSRPAPAEKEGADAGISVQAGDRGRHACRACRVPYRRTELARRGHDPAGEVHLASRGLARRGADQPPVLVVEQNDLTGALPNQPGARSVRVGDLLKCRATAAPGRGLAAQPQAREESPGLSILHRASTPRSWPADSSRKTGGRGNAWWAATRGVARTFPAMEAICARRPSRHPEGGRALCGLSRWRRATAALPRTGGPNPNASESPGAIYLAPSSWAR